MKNTLGLFFLAFSYNLCAMESLPKEILLHIFSYAVPTLQYKNEQYLYKDIFSLTKDEFDQRLSDKNVLGYILNDAFQADLATYRALLCSCKLFHGLLTEQKIVDCMQGLMQRRKDLIESQELNQRRANIIKEHPNWNDRQVDALLASKRDSKKIKEILDKRNKENIPNILEGIPNLIYTQSIDDFIKESNQRKISDIKTTLSNILGIKKQR